MRRVLADCSCLPCLDLLRRCLTPRLPRWLGPLHLVYTRPESSLPDTHGRRAHWNKLSNSNYDLVALSFVFYLLIKGSDIDGVKAGGRMGGARVTYTERGGGEEGSGSLTGTWLAPGENTAQQLTPVKPEHLLTLNSQLTHNNRHLITFAYLDTFVFCSILFDCLSFCLFVPYLGNNLLIVNLFSTMLIN